LVTRSPPVATAYLRESRSHHIYIYIPTTPLLLLLPPSLSLFLTYNINQPNEQQQQQQQEEEAFQNHHTYITPTTPTTPLLLLLLPSSLSPSF
jgi:hypothetical protein